MQVPRSTDASSQAGRLVVLLLGSVVALSTGCAQVPYEPGYQIEVHDTLRLEPGEPQFERGEPHRFIDGLGHYVVSLPSKLLLWNWDVDNHDISLRTEAALRTYLRENGLDNVKVRLNQYEASGEWERLFKNDAIHPVWRYTVGVIATAFYTLFPGRVFGGDNYNPYTNTINLYSDHESIALHEASHAKDFAKREWKGLYAFLYVLPLFPIYHEAVATGDTIGYHKWKQDTENEKADYKILYPAYATHVGGQGVQWLRVDTLTQHLIRAAAVIPGHIAGRIKAAQVEEPSASETPPNDANDLKEALSPDTAE